MVVASNQGLQRSPSGDAEAQIVLRQYEIEIQ